MAKLLKFGEDGVKMADITPKWSEVVMKELLNCYQEKTAKILCEKIVQHSVIANKFSAGIYQIDEVESGNELIKFDNWSWKNIGKCEEYFFSKKELLFLDEICPLMARNLKSALIEYSRVFMYPEEFEDVSAISLGNEKAFPNELGSLNDAIRLLEKYYAPEYAKKLALKFMNTMVGNDISKSITIADSKLKRHGFLTKTDFLKVKNENFEKAVKVFENFESCLDVKEICNNLKYSCIESYKAFDFYNSESIRFWVNFDSAEFVHWFDEGKGYREWLLCINPKKIFNDKFKDVRGSVKNNEDEKDVNIFGITFSVTYYGGLYCNYHNKKMGVASYEYDGKGYSLKFKYDEFGELNLLKVFQEVYH